MPNLLRYLICPFRLNNFEDWSMPLSMPLLILATFRRCSTRSVGQESFFKCTETLYPVRDTFGGGGFCLSLTVGYFDLRTGIIPCSDAYLDILCTW